MGTKPGKSTSELKIAQLQENQEILDAIIASSFDAIVAIDTEKKIIEFNHQAELLTGYMKEEVKGQLVESLYEDKKKAGEIYRTLQQEAKIDQVDITLLGKDGSRIPASLSGSLFVSESGVKLGQVGFIRDLRGIHLLEARLKALIDSSKAINSSLEIRTILDNVVHSALLAVPAADRGSLHLFNERSGRLEMRISSMDYTRTAWEEQSFLVGEGIAGWVYQQQTPAIVPDVSSDPHYQARGGMIPSPSMLCVPITSKQRQVGVMTLSNSRTPDAFKPSDLDFLVGFADQAAAAIDNSEQVSRIRKEAEDLEFLRGISLKINAQMSMEHILTTVLDSGNKLLGTEMAVVHWRGRNHKDDAAFVVPKELQRLVTDPREEDGLTAEALRSMQTIVIPDTTQDSRVNPMVIDVGIRSLVGCPLVMKDRVAGVLFFNSRRQQFFGEHEVHLISLLLSLAAVAIENAEIVERLDRNRRLAEALTQVSSQLAATHDLGEQVTSLKQFMQRELSAPMFYLGLYNEDTETIEILINHDNGVDLELLNINLKGRTEWTISSYVVKKQQPILWFNAEQKHVQCQELGINPLKVGTSCQTCLAFPLEVAGNIMGVISIQSTEPEAWDEIEVSTFRTFAHQASIAIRNSRLHQQIQKVRSTAMKVAEMTILGDLKPALESIVTGIRDVLGCDIVTLWTYWQDRDEFDLHPAVAGEVHFPEKMSGTRTIERSATQYKVIGMKDIYIAEDTQQDPLLGSPFSIRENVASSVAAPLITRGRRVGVLFINYCHEKHNFTGEELANIRLFSHQAAVAISNAMLYTEEQKRREVLKIIDEAGRTVTGSLQLDEIFDNLAHQVYELTGERGERASFATITLVEAGHTVLMAAYPPDEEQAIHHAGLERIELEEKKTGRIGIVGRAALKKAPVLVRDVADDPDFLRSNPETRCELAVPILYQDEVVGVINVEHNRVGGLDEEDLRDIQSLAAHAAVAIQNARLYQTMRRKSEHQQAIYEASKIINANLELPRRELQDLLVRQMVRIVPSSGASNILGAIHAYNVEKKELTLATTYPPEAFGPHKVGETRSLDEAHIGRIGITGRAALSGRPMREGDVTRVGDYLNYNTATRSELDVPMLEAGKVIGVLSLECDQLNGFDQDAEDALSAFAELAVVAVQNARRYRELREARAMVGNITAVAWMGLVAGAWRHSIGNMATTISDLSLLAQTELERKEPPEKIIPRMKKIQEIVEEIQKIPMPPLSSEAVTEPLFICQLVRDRVNQFRNKKDRYGGITFEMEFEIDELSKVRASPEWMRRILDILIDNASNAMKGRAVRRIDVRLRPSNHGVELLFSDTGTGIPESLRETLFREPIKKKENEKGSGIGLFLANTVIQTFGGKLEIRSTGPDGTTMALWFPLLE